MHDPAGIGFLAGEERRIELAALGVWVKGQLQARIDAPRDVVLQRVCLRLRPHRRLHHLHAQLPQKRQNLPLAIELPIHLVL